MRIWILLAKMNADPGGSGSETLQFSATKIKKEKR
jgi:hypothetical protein